MRMPSRISRTLKSSFVLESLSIEKATDEDIDL